MLSKRIEYEIHQMNVPTLDKATYSIQSDKVARHRKNEREKKIKLSLQLFSHSLFNVLLHLVGIVRLKRATNLCFTKSWNRRRQKKQRNNDDMYLRTKEVQTILFCSLRVFLFYFLYFLQSFSFSLWLNAFRNNSSHFLYVSVFVFVFVVHCRNRLYFVRFFHNVMCPISDCARPCRTQSFSKESCTSVWLT